MGHHWGSEQARAAPGCPDSAVQVVTVAAPRSRSYWDEVREAIAENASAQGGKAETVEGDFGPALALTMPVKTKDGKRARTEDGKALAQPSYVVGIDGPRWMLRATFLGRAALHADAREALMPVLRSIVVVRGSEAKVPGEPLVLTPAAPPEGQQLIMSPGARGRPVPAGPTSSQSDQADEADEADNNDKNDENDENDEPQPA